MKNLTLNLFVALLAFSIGTSVFSFWNKSYSVDERLAAVLTALGNEEIEVRFKMCRHSPEDCERMEQFARSQIVNRAAEDVENANKLCQRDNLSDAQCARRKEIAINDIEKNMLGKWEQIKKK